MIVLSKRPIHIRYPPPTIGVEGVIIMSAKE